MTNIDILKRLYKDYTKRHLKKILLALLLSVAVAGSTSAIAYLLDPAINFYNPNINCNSIRSERAIFIYSEGDYDRRFRRSEKRCSGKYAR